MGKVGRDEAEMTKGKDEMGDPHCKGQDGSRMFSFPRRVYMRRTVCELPGDVSPTKTQRLRPLRVI